MTKQLKRVNTRRPLSYEDRKLASSLVRTFQSEPARSILARQQIFAFISWLLKTHAALHDEISPWLSTRYSPQAFASACGSTVEEAFRLITLAEQIRLLIPKWKTAVSEGRTHALLVTAPSDAFIAVADLKGIEQHLSTIVEQAREYAVELQAARAFAAPEYLVKKDRLGQLRYNVFSLVRSSLFTTETIAPSPTLSVERDKGIAIQSRAWNVAGNMLNQELVDPDVHISWLKSLRIVCRPVGETYDYSFKAERTHEAKCEAEDESFALIIGIWAYSGAKRLGEIRIEPNNVSPRSLNGLSEAPEAVRLVFHTASSSTLGAGTT
jgi:hypothetical protein